MKRVYVAGPYSSCTTLGTFANVAAGLRASLAVWKAGYAPYIPWLDVLIHLINPDVHKTTVQECYDWSMAWLEASDAVLVLPSYKKSKGTIREICRAKELKIPIFYSLSQLNRHFSFTD
jgi:hypothetical protein